MASHNLSWVPGVHVRFGDLDFIAMTEGDLAMAPAVVRPLHSAGLDVITEALEELQLYAPEARAPRSDQLLDAFLGPRPSWEDLRHFTFSFANVIA